MGGGPFMTCDGGGCTMPWPWGTIGELDRPGGGALGAKGAPEGW